MKILVFGAGGVGGYFGGRLVQAGANVTFVARGPHLEALRSRGLSIESIVGDVHLSTVQATDDLASLEPVDVVLSCVKMDHLAETTAALKPLLKPSTLVVPLQNGVEAPGMVADTLGREHAGAGMCRVVSFIAAPGVIHHITAQPSIVLGEIDNRGTERIYRLQQLLDAAPGMSAEIPPDIQVALWRKFILFAAGSGLGALTRVTMDIVRSQPETRSMLWQLMQETTAVGQALGIKVSADDAKQALAFVDRLAPGSTTSLQRDIMEGRPSELHYQSGAVVRLGRQAAVPTPTHEFVYHALLPQERLARGE